MNVVEKIFRFGLAAYSLVISGDRFFRFSERPAPPMEAQEFLINLTSVGYVWETVGAIFLVAAILLLRRNLVGLAMVVMLPVMVSLVLFTIFVETTWDYDVPGLLLCLLYLIVGWFNRGAFASLIGR